MGKVSYKHVWKELDYCSLDFQQTCEIHQIPFIGTIDDARKIFIKEDWDITEDEFCFLISHQSVQNYLKPEIQIEKTAEAIQKLQMRTTSDVVIHYKDECLPEAKIYILFDDNLSLTDKFKIPEDSILIILSKNSSSTVQGFGEPTIQCFVRHSQGKIPGKTWI
uniref:Uncharacterized protein n=1 Tax=Panagrolaimus sp. JU765 TaxID=591449 RepID=A0AC34QSA6_9BILA